MKQKMTIKQYIEKGLKKPKKDEIQKLKDNYEKICNQYVSMFCEKQDMSFEFWVANEVGGIALCSDFFFSFSDIVLDINTKQKKGKIIKWYDVCLQNHKNHVNYSTYIKITKNEKKRK